MSKICQTRNTQSPSAAIQESGDMHKVPNEILLKLGKYLDKTSRLPLCGVDSLWFDATDHHVCFDISMADLYHPSFPVNLQGDASDPGHSRLRRFLARVWSLEWRDDCEPQEQIPTMRSLGLLLPMANRLTSLILRTRSDTPDPVLMESMRGFQALKSLDIDMAASENNRIRIETMFSLFSRLDCLCLSGWWYHNESDKITRLPPKRQWRIKNLKIDPIDTSLIRHCPVLHELKTVEPNFDMFGRMDLIRNTLAQKLQQPSSLETLEFFCDPRRAFFKFKINHPDRVDPSKPHGLEGSSAPYYGTNRPSFPLWWSTTEVVHILQ